MHRSCGPGLRILTTCVLAALCAAAGPSGAQPPATPASTPAPAPAAAAQPDYHPSLGDLMTMAVQPRHTKLGLAGRERNWAYAEYELSELRNAFGRVARTVPVYRNTDLTALMNAMTTQPLDAVERAIRAGDATQFDAAYLVLTDTCNACHRSQEHPMVVIRVPPRGENGQGANPYADQDFRPQKQH